MSWLAGVGAAVSIKLSSSIDDVVWLAPFLTNNSSSVAKLHNAAIYISVCLTQTIVAMAIAYSGDSLVGMLTKNAKDAWSTDKILTVVAGSMLAVYSVKLTYEYIQEMGEEGESSEEVTAESLGDEEAQEKELAFIVGGQDGEEELATKDCNVRQQKKEESSRTQALFIIAFLGSVDDLTLFVPMLVGKGFDMVQLVIGGLVAASAIVLLCVFVGLCKPVADCLSKVPLAAIVVVFAITLLVKGCTMQ
mmetsp:Transcript_95445/g.239217  ORF Transcript_95445/g.239217 Transcript_95445/m.239217 type:complete len:248 (-) Transcript_95445:157-900(-)